MTKFCTKCGKKLEGNEKCTCEKIKKETKEVSNIDIFDKIKNFLKKPVSSLNETDYLENNDYLVLIFTSLSYGLLGYFTFRIPIFIESSLISFLFFILFALVISLIQPENCFNKNIKIIATSSIILLVGNLVAFLVSFLSIILAFIIAISSGFLFILYVYHGLMESSDSDLNELPYKYMLIIMITIAIMSVFIGMI
jgi:hypothetical protein